MVRTKPALALAAFVLLGLLGTQCTPPPPIFIDTPRNNVFHELDPGSNALVVSGGIGSGVDLGTAIVTLHLNTVGPANGIPVTLNPIGRFSVPVDVDFRTPGATAQLGLNTVFARLRKTNDPFFDRRVAVTVVVGENRANEWGSVADTAIALRLNASGLDKLAEAIGGSLAQGIDLAALIGTTGNGQPRQLLTQQCIPVSSCIFRVDAFVRSVTHGALSVAVTPHYADAGGWSDIDITVPVLRVRFEAYDVAPPLANIYCSGTITANPLRASSRIDQLPNGGHVRVQQASAQAGFTNFQLQFDSAAQICSYPPLTAYLQSTLAPQIEALAQQQMVGALLDPDGAGPQRPLIELAVEDAINAVGIEQQLGPALRMDLNAAFTRIEEDEDGITYWTNTAPTVLSTRCQEGLLFPGACPAFGPESYLIPLPSSAPVAGSLAPSGSPYDMGLYLSESFLGQIVKGFASSGGLSGRITSLPSCATYNPSGSLTLTVGCLFKNDPFVIGLTGLLATETLEIRYRPMAAPIFTPTAPPLASQASLSIGGMELELRRFLTNVPEPVGEVPSETLATMLLRLNGGLSLAFDSQNEKLGFEIEYCTAPEAPQNDPPTTCSPDASATTLYSNFPNPMVSASLLDFAVNGSLLPEVILPTLTTGIASFDVPGFLDFQLQEVQTTRDQDFLGVFLDLIQPPPCPGCN